MTPEEQLAWLAREQAILYCLKRGYSIKVQDQTAVKGLTIDEAIAEIQRRRQENQQFTQLLRIQQLQQGSR